MPNELVRRGDGAGDEGRVLNALGHPADASEGWDLPPEQMGFGPRGGADVGPVHDESNLRAARMASDDAIRARARGDREFAGLRESDAGDLRQSMWDLGDGRTWMWLIGMCVVFLLMVALCYFLPYGRHSSPPPIRVY